MSSEREALLGYAMRLKPIHPSIGAAAGFDVDLSADGRVRGHAALGQALTLAMVTLRGSDVFARGFGFAGLAAIGAEVDPLLKRERLRLAVIDVLRTEPRIRRILSVRFADETHAPGSRSLEMLAEFETIAATRQAAVMQGEINDVR